MASATVVGANSDSPIACSRSLIMEPIGFIARESAIDRSGRPLLSQRPYRELLEATIASD